MQRTFSIIKPDATKRNITGSINKIIEENNLRIIAQKRIKLSKDQAEEFYSIHSDKSFFKDLIDYMISEPVIVQVLESDNAVEKYREIINLGLIDVFRNFNKKEGCYTFWDYMKGSWQKNNGLRIDHMLISSPLIDLVKKVEIIKNIRSQIKPSDHVPLECNFN